MRGGVRIFTAVFEKRFYEFVGRRVRAGLLSRGTPTDRTDQLNSLQGRAPHTPAALETAPVPQLAHAIQVIAFCVIHLSSMLWLLEIHPAPVQFLTAVLCATSCLAIMIKLCWPGRYRRRARYRVPALAVLALLSFAPVSWLGLAWLGIPGFLGGAMLLLFPGPVSWGFFVLLVVLTGRIAADEHQSLLGASYFVGSTVLSGLSVFGLTRLSDMVLKLRAAREALALHAVEQERLRFARDLHDLLGYSLSTIVLRGELTLRLVQQDPVRAGEEVSAILDVSRQALSDIRGVARAYRDLSLGGEVVSARSVLVCAGIEVEERLDLVSWDLPTPVSTVLATALREGVTNILRHSRARRCLIAVRSTGTSIVLTLANDGADVASRASTGSCPGSGGTGLGNLEVRLASVGGTLTVGCRTSNEFRLEAEVPLALDPVIRNEETVLERDLTDG